MFARAALSILGLICLPACGGSKSTGDAAAGAVAFVEKGCVICHAVNGVGGEVAPALDYAEEADVDPIAFSARIYSGAEAMVALQKVELGYKLELTPVEIADLAAFAADKRAQSKFSIEDVPQPMRDGFLNDVFWEEIDMSDFLPDETDGGPGEADVE